MSPTSVISRLSTVANTGRRIDSSGRVIGRPQVPDGAAGLAPGAPAPPGATTRTGMPSRILSTPAVTTTSFGERPSTTSTSPALRGPMRILVKATLPSTTRKTNWFAPTGTIDASGTKMAFCRDSTVKRDAREQARAQHAVGIVDGGTQEDRAAGRVDQRIDGVDDAGEGPADEGVDLDRDVLARPDRGQQQLGHAEIDLEPVDDLEIDDVGTGPEIARRC